MCALVSCVQDASEADGGQYKCSAQNEFGTSNANLTLNMGK